jgi:hypothetical protein
MKEGISSAIASGSAVKRDVKEDRGDVPGWVLITLMTAGLVAVIWAVAGPTLTNLFTSAIEGVTGG